MSTPCSDYDHTKGLSTIAAEIEAQRQKVALETARLQALLSKQDRQVPRTIDRE